MNKLRTIWATFALAAVSAVYVPAALAAETNPPRDMTLEELVAMVKTSLPPILTNPGPKEVVRRLLQAKMDPESLQKKFNPTKVATAVFGRGRGTPDALCAQPLTAALDRDEGECTVTDGKTSEDPKQGAFSMLAFSKNMALGNITILKRPDFSDITPDTPSVKLTDAEAYEKARKFAVDTIGLSPNELAPPPPGTAIPPINILSLGFNIEGIGGTTAAPAKQQIDFMKVVLFPRALALPEPIVDPKSQLSLTHLLGPGQAVFFVNDLPGVQGARVENWASMPIDTQLSLDLVKPADDLAREIAEDLYARGGKRAATLQMSFALGPASNPNPDDPNSPHCPACGAVLRPVLRVALYTFDATEPPQGYVAAPGLVEDYQLVQGAPERPTRLLR